MSLLVQSLNRRAHEVRGHTYVLAAGGIENTRLRRAVVLAGWVVSRTEGRIWGAASDLLRA